MKYLNKTEWTYKINAFYNGILFIKRPNNTNGNLIFESDKINLSFSNFDVCDYKILHSSQIICFSSQNENDKGETCLLDENFTIIKKYESGDLISSFYKNTFFGKINNQWGIYDKLSSDIIRKINYTDLSGGFVSFNDKYLVNGNSDTGILSIQGILNDSIQHSIEIYKIFNIDLDDDRHFKFGYNLDDKIIIFVDFYFIIIDCLTGGILFKLNTEIGFYQFEVRYPVVYCKGMSTLAKYRIDKDCTIENIYIHRLERAENEYVGKDYISLSFMREMFIHGDKIYGINTSTPSFLLIQDANTGKRVKAIDLRPFGIQEAWQAVVSNDKIYITDFNCNAWVFERENSE